VEQLKHKLRDVVYKGRGKSLLMVIAHLTPILRGWINYFKLAEIKTFRVWMN
jgi:RNA-directed DNA polymerase